LKTSYLDLIDQTFYFPQEEFQLKDGCLEFHDIPIMELIKTYGTPLKFTYLPKISSQIKRSKELFADALKQNNYAGEYHYCYCTKSSHFSYVMKQVLKEDVHLETSSAYDINIIQKMLEQGYAKPTTKVLCNGYKDMAYLEKIAELIASGHKEVLPIVDSFEELDRLGRLVPGKLDIGVRIATEEQPKFEFYTSRLGLGYNTIRSVVQEKIAKNSRYSLKMLHFFVNTGITDTAYYWNELNKCVRLYCDLKEMCPELTALDIGGGLPIKNRLNFQYDYAYMIQEIVNQIKLMCKERGVPEPDLYTEFGSFTVGESGASIYSVLDVKHQNDRERWYMIDSSFMTTLPDAWAISKRFILLPINNWDQRYQRVLLGGMTCDSDDYYNSEQHSNAVYLPEFTRENPLYIGFFNTGAYQDTIGGFGGIQHCLIPKPQHLVIDRLDNGKLSIEQFAPRQSADSMMSLLGYGG
jgi:arginine decarboxylase